MIEELDRNIAGVVCLYCGVYTPLPVSTKRSPSTGHLTMFNPPLSIIRCHRCGKEAPYLADDVVIFKSTSIALSHAA